MKIYRWKAVEWRVGVCRGVRVGGEVGAGGGGRGCK